MINVNKIVKNSVKLVLTETLYGLLLSLISFTRKILDVVIMQYGNTSEIQRLKGESSLTVSETLMNYNNVIHVIAIGFSIIIVILMSYSFYKFIINTFNNQTKPLKRKNI